MDSKAILDQFIYMPIISSDAVFAQFAQLPGAVHQKGERPLQQFVFVPGSRKDRILLVAHADTVWHKEYGNPQGAVVIFENGVYSSGDPNCGIGADDRAGCAMLWALRDCGHSLLIVDGEEKGKHGAKYLRDEHGKLFRQLNKHRFMIEMDWAGTGGSLYNQVDNSDAFKTYIQKETGFVDSRKKGGCDLQILCRDVCGVNLSTGWHGCHTPKETLSVADWENTYNRMVRFLEKPQPKFPIPLKFRIRKTLQRGKAFLGRILRKLRILPVK